MAEADELEIPGSPEQLYLARGEEVNPHRPLLQGDVFDNTPIPGVDDERARAIITTHACDMRGSDGVALTEHLHLARVQARGDPPNLRGWFKYHPREMPLPNLLGESDESFTAELDLVGRSRTDELGERVACLDLYGITILQQRIVHRATRVKISKDVFDEQTAPVFAEAELMEEWIEASTTTEIPRDEAEREFHEFLRSDRGTEPPLQSQLQEAAKRPHVRQVVRQELAKRFRP